MTPDGTVAWHQREQARYLDDGLDWRTLRYDEARRTLYVTFDGTPDVDVAEFVLPGFAKRLLRRVGAEDEVDQ